MNVEDFIESTYSSFETKITIWKKEIELFLNFPKNTDKKIFLESNLANIDNKLTFIEKNKNIIEEILYEEDLIELAETITSSAPLLECASEECYMLDDGSNVSFPITKDDFFDSLYIESITMNFNEKNEIKSSELILLCGPDYFRGKYFIVNIDENNKIKFIGLEE